jgi:hypothetical protein
MQMSSWARILVAAGAFCAVTAAATLSAQADRGGQGNHYGWDKGGGGGHGGGKGDGGGGGSRGAPGPIAGAGLPILLFAGGFALARRYRRRTDGEAITPAET